MADHVTIRNEQGHERQVAPTAVPFFVNQGFVVLDAAGRVKAKQPVPASDNKKDNG